MKLSLSRRLIFYLILSCFFAFSIGSVISLKGAPADLSSARVVLRYLTEFDQFFVELFFLLLVANLFIYKNFFWRIILYFLCSAFIAVYSVQLISLHYTGEFISSLAIDNVDHLYLFFDPFHILILALLFSCIFFTIYLTEHGTVPTGQSHHFLTFVLLTLMVFVSGVSAASLWLPDISKRTETSIKNKHQFKLEGPLVSLAATLYLKSHEYVKTVSDYEMSAAELSVLKKMGFPYNRRSPYPLLKDTIYSDDSPFPFKPNNRTDAPNVIVIFSEGLSARAIGAYGSVYSDLTPFIDDFSRKSMIVERYYNHTAATYRGLHGQLASIFPLYGGVGGWHSEEIEVSGRSYLTLADLFKRRNYETIFLDSHHKDHRSRVDEMMAELGFETVVTGDEMAEAFLDNSPPLENMAYSDQQYFNGVIAYLQNRQSGSSKDKPFFMSLYNFGTHSFLNHSQDGYRYHSHNNVVLNNTHNLDFAFGRFWNYIKTSSYSKNTVLVFTSDHCHFHDSAFLDAFSEPDYEKKFIDRIPLIIWDPTRSIPSKYDARNASSIDFAPTMAHYFGLDNVKNPFLGMSIFEREWRLDRKISVAALGSHEIYLIDGVKIQRLGEENSDNLTLKALDKYIGVVRLLELENRIWDDALGSD